MEQNITKPEKSPLQTALAISAGFSFYIVCMIFSMVGPTGSRVPVAMKNKITVLSMLFVTLALAGGSAYVGMLRRRRSGAPMPWVMLGLCALCLLVILGVLINAFSI